MIEKKEIYSNYKRQNKWLGIIDYKTLTIISIYCIVILYVVIKLNLSFTFSVNIFCILISPAIVILFVNGKNDSAVDILIIIIRFAINMKIFVNLDYYNSKKSYRYIKQEK